MDLSMMQAAFFRCVELVKYVPELLFVQPLRTLYFKGPRLMGWGGWEGILLEDICSQLTTVPASIWRDQLSNCQDLVERKFQTFLVTISILSYCFVLYKVVAYLWFRYFVVAPILAEIQRMLPTQPCQHDLKLITCESKR